MKYLLLAYHHEKKWDSMSQSEKDKAVSGCHELDAELEKAGYLHAGGSLGPTSATVSVRPRNGKPLVTDGPYVETKEQLGGFVIIEAKDLNEAIQVASRHPAACMNEGLGWGVELRPFEFYKQT